MTILSDFYDSIISNTDKYYAFVGHPDKDYTPTNLANDLLLAKRIAASNIIKSIKRVDWTYGEVYKQYTKTEYDNSSLNGTKFYAATFVDGVYKIYKCINNNNGSPSFVSPSTINRYGVVTLDDGYSWIYMYQIPKASFDQFNTFDYIPFIPDATSAVFASAGTIDNIQITNVGFNYTYCVVGIVGDGTGATAIAEIENSTIKRVVVTSIGSGYTYATVTFIGDGVGASAVAVIPPTGGHASNQEAELYCSSLTLSVDIDTEEDVSVLPYNVGYSKYGILKNITLNNFKGDLAVDYVDVVNGGSGYRLENKPKIEFVGGFNPDQITNDTAVYATGYPSMDNTSVSRIVLSNNGKNYVSTPTVQITGGDGSGTVFQTVMRSVPIKCYFSINVSSYSGSFRKNEIIKQGTTTAKVLFDNAENGVIGVYDIVGTFAANTPIEGTSSGAFATTASNVLNSPDIAYNDTNLFAIYDNTQITRQQYQTEKINIVLVF